MRVALGTTARKRAVVEREIAFENFVHRFTCPERLKVTEEEYHQLAISDQKALKDGSYFTPCLFSGNSRNLPEATTIALVVLDIDTPEDARQVMENADMLLDGWQWILHSTTSSTAEHPRLRLIVFPEAGIPAEVYPALVATVAGRLGIESSVESRVACQPMYLPRVPSDQNYFSCVSLDGSPLRVSEASEAVEGSARSCRGGDPLEYMVSPDEAVTDDMVLAMLAQVDPDCDRDTWVRVCCALKHQYQNNLGMGFEIFNEWSAGSPSKYSLEATNRQWEYEQANPPDRTPITIRSLSYMVRDQIPEVLADQQVDRNSRLESLKEGNPQARDFLDRLAACTSVAALTQDYPAEIGAMGDGAVVRQMMLEEVARRITEVTGRKPSKKELLRVANVSRSSEAALDVADKHSWAVGWAYSRSTDEYITPSGERVFMKAVDAAYGRFLMSDPNYYSANGRPTISPAAFLMNVVSTKVVKLVTYRPDKPPLEVFTENGEEFFNSYSEQNVPATEDDCPEAGQMLVDHLKWLTPTNYQTILDFLAFLVQCPGLRVNWAILLKGPQGIGKTMLSDLMKAVIGADNVTTLSASIFSTSFTDWAEGRTLSCVEEVRVSGQNRFAAMDAIKPFITNEEVTINRKFVSQYSVRNVTSYLMFTNHEDALAIDDDDRRYCVIRCEPTADEVRRRNAGGYYAKFYGFIKNRAGALRHFLLNHQISPKFSATGHAPLTDDRKFMRFLAKSDIQVMIEDMLEANVSPLVQPDLLSSAVISLIAQAEYGEKIPNRLLSHALVQMGFRKIDLRMCIGSTRHTLWVSDEFIITKKNAPQEFRLRTEFW